MSKKGHMRPRSLSNTVKPLSSRLLPMPAKIPPTLKSLKESTRIPQPLNSTLPQLRNERAMKFEEASVNLFNNSFRNKLTKAKNSQSMRVPVIPAGSGSTQTATYTIKLISNWGSPDLIACSEIIPIDYQSHHLPVLEITAFPRKVNLTEISKLIRGFENHEDSTDIWTCSWPQQTPIEINMVVPIDSPIKMIRFFNASDVYKEAGIRNVEIWSDDILLWEGEIPYDLPYVAHLNRPTPNSNNHLNFSKNKEKNIISRQHEVLPANPLNCYVDPFGIVPQLPSQSLTIEFYSNYENSSAFGLSGIEVLTTKKELLKKDDFSEIKVNNLSTAANLDTLFRGQYMNPTIDDMFVFERSDNELNPSISIIFKNPTLVGQLRIWNFFPSCGSGEDYDSNKENKAKQGICVKNISIKFDNNNPIFIGKINRGDGTLKRLETSMTIIFVNEMDYKFIRSTKYQNLNDSSHNQQQQPQQQQQQQQPSQINSSSVPHFF